MDNTYTQSMQNHIQQLDVELDGLAELLASGPLGTYEYRACERTVQILIEASIGIAKQCCKKADGVAPVSAYQSFARLTELQLVQSEQVRWKQIIGMRDALVHDYLNIDREIIEHLVINQHYKPVVYFALHGLKWLSSSVKE